LFLHRNKCDCKSITVVKILNIGFFQKLFTMKYRIESDSLGSVHVPENCYWGAQTQRSLENFCIGNENMPLEQIYALVWIKKASAKANYSLGHFEKEKYMLISAVCDEILQGKLDDQFPLKVWQTGSGTQTNMNVNEVIAHRGCELAADQGLSVTIHPNDDVNRSQSTNDTFPSAMRIASYQMLTQRLMPALEYLKVALMEKSEVYRLLVKTGRTHLMDATPITLGQEIGAWASQISHGIQTLQGSLPHLLELPLGGTAVGNGLNAPAGFDVAVVENVSAFTGCPFIVAPDKFEAMASHDALVEAHAAIKRVAVSLMKIVNDIRLLGSGPRCGFGELILPANEPGSSIMPGKINPTQAEAMAMVCAQVMGNDTTITIAGANGHLQLNANMPVIIRNMMHSARILADAVHSFAEKTIAGLEASTGQISKHLHNSLMLVTALNTTIGYEKAAEIAKLAYEQHLTLRQAALKTGYLTPEAFDRIVDPAKMAGV